MASLKELKILQLKKLAQRKREQDARSVGSAQDGIIEGAKELAVDVPVKVVEGVTFGFGDEIVGGATASAKKIAGSDKSFSELYRESRDNVRSVQDRASERSPVGSFIAEAVGTLPYGGGGIGKTALQSAMYGAGVSNEEDSYGVAIDSVISGGIGGGFHAIGKAGTMLFDEPEKKLARQMGLDPSQIKKGLKYLEDPESKVSGVVDRLRKKGLFKGNPSRPDMIKKLSSEMKVLSERMNRALKSKAPDASERMTLSPRLVYDEREKLVPKSGVQGALGMKDKVKESVLIGEEGAYVPEGVWTKDMFLDDMADAIDDVRDKLHQQFGQSNEKKIDSMVASFLDEFDKPEGIDLLYAQEKKKSLYKKLKSAYNNPETLDGVATETEEAMASVLKKFIDKHAPETKDINKAMSDIHFVEHGPTRSAVALRSAVGQDGGGLTLPLGGESRQFLEGTKEYLAEPTRTARGRIGAGVRDALDSTRLGSDGASDVSRSLAIPASNSLIDGENSREPQSVRNIPEELIRTPIPRSTEGILENKEVLRLKLAQQGPQIYEQVMEVVDNQPELIPDVVPVISQVLPHLFENDKYGRFDGVIVDPKKKEMARQDLMMMDSLSNVEKMIKMDSINKTGEFDL